MQQGVRAHARFQRISPRKARLVIDLIRNLNIAAARDQLMHSAKGAAPMVLKLLNSAVANAQHNNKLDEKDLVIQAAYVDEGPTLKRWRPRAFGRAAMIRKRTSHLTIIVDAKDGKKANTDKKADSTDSADKKETKAKKPDTKRVDSKKVSNATEATKK